MIIGKKNKLGKKAAEVLANGDFVEYKSKIKLSSGEMIRITRELQGMTQSELAEASGLTQSAVSALEGNRSTLGLDRAKAIARALKVHPSGLAFPNWDMDKAV